MARHRLQSVNGEFIWNMEMSSLDALIANASFYIYGTPAYVDDIVLMSPAAMIDDLNIGPSIDD
jgi:hypothetical protein